MVALVLMKAALLTVASAAADLQETVTVLAEEATVAALVPVEVRTTEVAVAPIVMVLLRITN
jgi:hypothetical protein